MISATQNNGDPLVPILIAIATLAVIYILAVVVRQRQDRRNNSAPKNQ